MDKQSTKMRSVAICLLFLLIITISGCASESNTNFDWNVLKPVPFGGYVCGFENTCTMLQFPVFYPSQEEISAEDISQINLVGDEVVIACSSFSFMGKKYNEENDYSLETLVLYAELPTEGEYTVDQMQIVLHDEKIIINQLGEILFVVERQDYLPEIYATQFMLNQIEPTDFIVTYRNESSDEIEILSLSYIDSMYSGISIRKFVDFETQIAEEGLYIPAYAERTFVFSFEVNQEYFSEDEERFLFVLPFVHYSINGNEKITTAVPQATVVQPLFTSFYVLSLLEGT